MHEVTTHSIALAGKPSLYTILIIFIELQEYYTQYILPLIVLPVYFV